MSRSVAAFSLFNIIDHDSPRQQWAFSRRNTCPVYHFSIVFIINVSKFTLVSIFWIGFRKRLAALKH